MRTGNSHPRLSGAVSLGAACAVARAARREDTTTISQNGAAPGLVDGQPVLDSIAECCKANLSRYRVRKKRYGGSSLLYLGVVSIILHTLVFVQPATITILQALREIPVVQGDKRNNPALQKSVDKARVPLNTSLVHGIVAAAKWDDAAPAQTKAV